jgi:phosphatidate phosphatase APP1
VSGWGRRLARIAHALEGQVDSAVVAVKRRVRGARPPRIFLYRGFGTEAQVRIIGRVMEDEPGRAATAEDPRWQNLLASLGRFDSDEVPGARVLVRYGARADVVVADHEGYFTIEPAGPGEADADPQWRLVAAELLSPPGIGGSGRVLVPAANARFGVISDLDDTVIQSGVRQVLQLLAATFLENARTRLPFPGVAAFYHALRSEGPGAPPNPIFYVSSSPWNLHDFLVEFLEVRGIPAGPVMLRDWGTSRDSLLPPGHHEHKAESIERVFATYPSMAFILIGDSGQQDPEIYRDMVERHPGRVMAIYIRDVSLHPLRSARIERLAAEVRELGSIMVLVADTIAAARHAAERGWIAAERIEAVARDLVETDAGIGTSA